MGEAPGGLDGRPGRSGTPVWSGRGVSGWAGQAAHLATPGEKVATRQSINACLNAIVDVVPGLVAGGADLTGNTGTKLDDGRAAEPSSTPRAGQIAFGVREHGMGGIMNGLAAPRRCPPRRRHLLRLQRLHAGRRSGWPPLSRPR